MNGQPTNRSCCMVVVSREWKTEENGGTLCKLWAIRKGDILWRIFHKSFPLLSPYISYYILPFPRSTVSRGVDPIKIHQFQQSKSIIIAGGLANLPGYNE